METKQIKVGIENSRQRIDSLVASEIPGISRSQIKELISGGKILRNGNTTKPGAKVNSEDIISIEIPEPEPMEAAPENIPLDILYQDHDIAVINKQAGLTVHPSGRTMTGTLVNALLYHISDLSGINGILRPGIVHRLDKDTTGIMVIAKNDLSHQHIAAQFESRTVSKTYTALVWGMFENPKGVIDKSIERSRTDRKKMISGRTGRKSLTEYEVIEEFSFLSLVKAYPKTGRTHQIRSHFSAIGHPIFGDELYSGRSKRLTGLTTGQRSLAQKLLKGFHRQALHASQLFIEHPSTGKELTFAAEPPEDFAFLLNELERDMEERKSRFE